MELCKSTSKLNDTSPVFTDFVRARNATPLFAQMTLLTRPIKYPQFPNYMGSIPHKTRLSRCQFDSFHNPLTLAHDVLLTRSPESQMQVSWFVTTNPGEAHNKLLQDDFWEQTLKVNRPALFTCPRSLLALLSVPVSA